MTNMLDTNEKHLFLEQTDNSANSFIANVNKLTNKLAELMQLNEKLTPDQIDILISLADIGADSLATDLSKGTFNGYRKLDIDLLKNFTGYRNGLTDDEKRELWATPSAQVYYDSITITFKDRTQITKTFQTAGVDTPIHSHHQLYTQLDEWAEFKARYGYTIFNISEDTALRNHELFRIIDGEGIGSTIAAISLHVAAQGQNLSYDASFQGAKEHDPFYTWVDTTSVLSTICNDLQSFIRIADSTADLAMIYQYLQELLALSNRIPEFISNTNSVYNSLKSINTVADNIATLDKYAYMLDKLVEAQESMQQVMSDVDEAKRVVQDVLRQVQENAEQVKSLTVDVTMLPSTEVPTSEYDVTTGTLYLGIPRGMAGIKGLDGNDGAVYVPKIEQSADGYIIRWENNKGLANPPAINIANGRVGLPPEHEWVGTALRFKNPDGTWGQSVNLHGDGHNFGYATSTHAGLIKVGENLEVDDNGVLKAIIPTINIASKFNRGIVQIGSGLDVDTNGIVSAAPATRNSLGAVQIGDNIELDPVTNTISVKPVKANQGLEVNELNQVITKLDDTLSVDDENRLGLSAKPVEIAKGGTSASTLPDAQNNLGITKLQKEVDVISRHGIRNAVLSGRMKDGYPAYLVHHDFLNMQHEDNVYTTRKGKITVSGEYNATYRGTKPLRNQVIWQSNGWVTPASTTNGWWQYDFDDNEPDHIITGLFIGNRDNVPHEYMKNWVFEGTNDGVNWIKIFECPNDTKLRGANTNLKVQGRMYWFTDNKVAYKKLRIRIIENQGGTVVGFSVVKMYETIHEANGKQTQFDVLLYGSEKEPFEASIAKSINIDSRIKLVNPVMIDGNLLVEQSRNYLYITDELPQNHSFKHIKEYLDSNNKKFYIINDTRRIHYTSLRELEYECAVLMQSSYTTNTDIVSDTSTYSLGAYDYPIKINGTIKALTEEQPRGAKSSFWFPGTGSNIIHPRNGTTVAASFPDKDMHPYNSDCTMEIDFKWNGPADTAADGIYVIFDNGQYSSAGWTVVYANRTKALYISINGSYQLAVPFNATDDHWHTLAISIRNYQNWYVHIDGKCVGKFTGLPAIRPYYRQWALGRWMSGDSAHWCGGLNNFRYTMGTCLYQGDDYVVERKFNKTLIPDKTLWWNPNRQCVCEWQADTKTWKDMPIVPIGHVDTGWKHELHTDQPTGTYGQLPTKYVESVTQTALNNAATAGISILNFGDAGINPYYTPNTAKTTEHVVDIYLTELKKFEAFKICFGDINTSPFRAPAIFKIEGLVGDNEETKVMLVDRTEFVDDGGLYYVAHTTGIGAINSYKELQVVESSRNTAVNHLRITFPPKADIPFYNTQDYTECKLRATFTGAKPEILAISSYCINDTWMYGPIQASINQELLIPVPFENLRYTTTGFVQEENDWQTKVRLLGQQGYIYNDTYYGEGVYQYRDKLCIQIARTHLNLYNNTHNTNSVAAASDNANIYLICRREQ